MTHPSFENLTKRSIAGWVLAAAGLCAAVGTVRYCGRSHYAERRAVFPTNAPTATLAIREPLVRPELKVMATLRESPGRGTAVWMSVDSGATGVTIPTSTYQSLGLEVLSGVRIRTEDARGTVLFHDAGLVPNVVLGPLVLSDVVTAIGGGTIVLGQSILGHSAWEVDWDRGRLTLGAVPWTADPQTIVLPMRREGDADVVTIHVDGAPIDMVLDTGAFASTIPQPVGSSAGLTALSTGRPIVFKSVAGELIVRTVFSGNVRLGELDVGRVRFASLSSGGRRGAFGLLGLDVLSRYQFQIEPGVRLSLRPRGDVTQTAAARIARWPFIPTCAHPGCVQAQLEPSGKNAALTVSFEADVRRPIELLLGCAFEQTEKVVRTESSFAFEGVSGESRHIRVRLPRGIQGAPSKTIIVRGESWFRDGGAQCHALTALDVSPTSLGADDAAIEDPGSEASSDGTGELQASLWP